MTGYAILIPELLLVAGAMWSLFAELLPGGDRGAARLGAALAVVASILAAVQPAGASSPFGDLLAFDGPARFARVAITGLAAIWLLWTAGRGTGRLREAVSLALFTAVGAMFMAEARELITLVVSIELATMPAYVLMGYRKDDVRGLEGALKYLLLSMLTSLVMLYGFSFLYGLTGSTHYARLDVHAAGTLGLLALLLSLVGILAKLSAAPFHYWAPDAYEGASPWAVAFVSTVPKVAGAVAIVRLLSAVAPSVAATGFVLAIVAVASMLLGNLGALTQTDLRRLMAYSGVAHAGYLLLGAAALSSGGYLAAVFYVVAYAIPSMGVMLVAAEEGPALADFHGLAVRRPAVAWSVVVMLLSLIGVPPLFGFFGKFSLFTAALRGGLAFPVVLAVMMSVVSAGYYLRIVRAMFTEHGPEAMIIDGAPAQRAPLTPSRAASVALAACVVAVVGLGIGAGPVIVALGQMLR